MKAPSCYRVEIIDRSAAYIIANTSIVERSAILALEAVLGGLRQMHRDEKGELQISSALGEPAPDNSRGLELEIRISVRTSPLEGRARR